MNNIELQALRRLLFFTQQEAADLVSGTSLRAVQHWEDGRRPVPADVAEKMFELAQWRENEIETGLATLRELHYPKNATLVYYEKMTDWFGEPIFWKPHQSACAALHFCGFTLKKFDSQSYLAWLGRRADSQKMRGAWVAQVAE
jgi:Domain of unknown function (DUF1870)